MCSVNSAEKNGIFASSGVRRQWWRICREGCWTWKRSSDFPNVAFPSKRCIPTSTYQDLVPFSTKMMACFALAPRADNSEDDVFTSRAFIGVACESRVQMKNNSKWRFSFSAVVAIKIGDAHSFPVSSGKSRCDWFSLIFEKNRMAVVEENLQIYSTGSKKIFTSTFEWFELRSK